MYLICSYSKLHLLCSQDAVPFYIHSTQPTWCWCPLMSSEAHLEAIQGPFKSDCSYSEGHTFRHFHHEVEATGFQSRGPVLLPSCVTSQKACCPLFQSRQGSCFVYRVFSCNWQVKLNLSQVQKRNTEKLLYLVSRPSLSGAGDKHRTLKRCSIKPWSSKHLLPSKSTSVA